MPPREPVGPVGPGGSGDSLKDNLDIPGFLRKRNSRDRLQQLDNSPVEDETPPWLKGVGQGTSKPPSDPDNPPVEDEIPDWLKYLGLDSTAPTNEPKIPAQTPAGEAVPTRKFSFQEKASPATGISPDVQRSSARRRFSWEKDNGEPQDLLSAAAQAAEEEPVIQVQVEEAQLAAEPEAPANTAPSEVTAEETTAEVIAPAVPEDAAALGLDAQPAEPEAPAETGLTDSATGTAPAEETPTGAASVDPTPTEDSALVEPHPDTKLSLTDHLSKLQFTEEESLSFVQDLEKIQNAPPSELRVRGKVIPKDEALRIVMKRMLRSKIPADQLKSMLPQIDAQSNVLLRKFKQAQLQKVQREKEAYVQYVTERSSIAPKVQREASTTKTFALDEPVISTSALKRMERRGPDVIDPVRKIDVSSEIINRRYWGYMADTLVDHQRLRYLGHVANTIAGSAGDVQAAVPLMSQIEGELRSAGYKRYKDGVLDLLDHDSNLGLRPEDTMLTLADERNETRSNEGQMVRMDIILGVAGLDAQGRTEPMELVHDLGGFIKIEVEKVKTLYQKIVDGTFTLGDMKIANGKILEEEYQRLIGEVNQRVQAEEERLGKSLEDKKKEFKALQRTIEEITNPFASLSESEREKALKPRRPQIAEIDLAIFKKESEIVNAQRELEVWNEQRDRVIKNMIASSVVPTIEVQEANMDQELREAERDLLPMTQAEREAYANGRLEQALAEGQTSMEELEKWAKLIANRSGVIEEAAALSVSYLTQIDHLIVSRNALMEKIEINNLKSDRAKASRDKKYHEELDRINKQIQKGQETAIAEVIPSREKMSAEARSTVGEMYSRAVIGTTAMIPNPDGKLEAVVKPGLYELAQFANLRIEIDDRARALQEPKAKSKQLPPVNT